MTVKAVTACCSYSADMGAILNSRTTDDGCTNLHSRHAQSDKDPGHTRTTLAIAVAGHTHSARASYRHGCTVMPMCEHLILLISRRVVRATLTGVAGVPFMVTRSAAPPERGRDLVLSPETSDEVAGVGKTDPVGDRRHRQVSLGQ